jgi:hypothetical protein
MALNNANRYNNQPQNLKNSLSLNKYQFDVKSNTLTIRQNDFNQIKWIVSRDGGGLMMVLLVKYKVLNIP